MGDRGFRPVEDMFDRFVLGRLQRRVGSGSTEEKFFCHVEILSFG
jgi:hypothetical protein